MCSHAFRPQFISTITSHGFFPCWVGKISPEGDSLWARQYIGIDNNNNRQNFYDLKETTDGGYILCGESRSPAASSVSQQGWLLKIDEHGCLIPGCQTTNTTQEPQSIIQLAIYPNPTIDYLNFYLKTLRQAKSSGFRIIDAQGRQFESFNHLFPEATYVLEVWDWPTGTYYLQYLENGQVLHTEKFIKQ